MAYTPAVGRSAAVEPVSSQSRLSVSGHCGLAWAGGCCTLAVGQKQQRPGHPMEESTPDIATVGYLAEAPVLWI